MTLSFLSLGTSQVTSADVKDFYRKAVNIDIGINKKNDLKEEFMYLGSNDVKSYNAANENKLDGDSKDSKESKAKDSYNNLLRGLRKAVQVTAFGVATCAFITSDFGMNVAEKIYMKFRAKGFNCELSERLVVWLAASVAVAGSALAASL